MTSPQLTNGLRIIRSGFMTNLKMLGTSSFFLLTSIVQPVIFATVAFYMFQSGGRSGTLLYAALGAGMMGVWSTTLFGSGGRYRTETFEKGDVGYSPQGYGHSIENVGDGNTNGLVRAIQTPAPA